jgi:hypothetical protein
MMAVNNLLSCRNLLVVGLMMHPRSTSSSFIQTSKKDGSCEHPLMEKE